MSATRWALMIWFLDPWCWADKFSSIEDRSDSLPLTGLLGPTPWRPRCSSWRAFLMAPFHADRGVTHPFGSWQGLAPGNRHALTDHNGCRAPHPPVILDAFTTFQCAFVDIFSSGPMARTRTVRKAYSPPTSGPFSDRATIQECTSVRSPSKVILNLDHSSDLWRDDSDSVDGGGESLTGL